MTTLGSEAVVQHPVMVTDEAGTNATAIHPPTCLYLSWDHHAPDGVLAARFPAKLRERLEDWR